MIIGIQGVRDSSEMLKDYVIVHSCRLYSSRLKKTKSIRELWNSLLKI